ncbi:MAG: hypothetical protein WA843_03050 [Candidatus Saccharimonadales bacterium]
MTEADLDAIEARAAAATRGPWAWDHSGVWQVNSGGPVLATCSKKDQTRGGVGYVGDAYPRGENNPSESMEFIAHAITDVPALITEIRRLREAINQSGRPHGA